MLSWIELIEDRLTGKAPKGARRSKHWRKTRKGHLKENPRCELCNGNKKITVHHVVPFHLAPDLELDSENLITLCQGKKELNCHLIFGHVGSFQKCNFSVRNDVREWCDKMDSKNGKSKS